MLRIFTEKDKIQSRHIIDYNLEMIRERYRGEISRVKYYFRESTKYLKSKHILTNMLETLNVDTSLDLDRYIELVEANTPRLYRLYRVGTSYNKPHPYTNMFYGRNSAEYMLGISDSGEAILDITNWRNFVPVRVLLHPNTDLNLEVTEPNYSYKDTELVVVEINLPLLAIQYKMWVQEQNEADTSTYEARFVKSYVLPNMLDSHVDLTLLNRLIQIHQDGEVRETYKAPKLPIAIIDYGSKLDKILKKLDNDIRLTKTRYQDLLEIIPGISTTYIWDSLRMPDIFPTAQIRAVLLIARLRYILFFIDLLGAPGERRNKHLINDLKYYVEKAENDSLFNDLPSDVAIEVIYGLEEINNLQ